LISIFKIIFYTFKTLCIATKPSPFSKGRAGSMPLSYGNSKPSPLPLSLWERG